MLRQNSTDGMSEMFWGFLGGGVAAAPTALEAIWAAYLDHPAVPISLLHLIEIVLLVVGLSGAVIVKFLSRGKGRRIEGLVTDIRAREAK